jgi:hypothetical protein
MKTLINNSQQAEILIRGHKLTVIGSCKVFCNKDGQCYEKIIENGTLGPFYEDANLLICSFESDITYEIADAYPNTLCSTIVTNIVIPKGRTVTESSTLIIEDSNTEIHANHATVAIVLTIPSDDTVAWDNNTVIHAYQGLVEAVSFAAGEGVTLRSPTGAATSTQYAHIGIKRVGANEWRLLR